MLEIRKKKKLIHLHSPKCSIKILSRKRNEIEHYNFSCRISICHNREQHGNNTLLFLLSAVVVVVICCFVFLFWNSILMCPFLADLLNLATRPTSALRAPCLRPHKKQTNHRHLCRLSMCVSVCECV